MKYRCTERIPRGKIDKLKDPYDLFMAMREHGYISETNTEMLKELLEKVGRVDLKNKVEKFMCSPANHSGNLCSSSYISNQTKLKHQNARY